MKVFLSILMLITAMSVGAVEKYSVSVLTNGVIFYPTNIWHANSNAINAEIHHPESAITNSINTVISNLVALTTNWAATLDGFKMSPAVSTTLTNSYWWDFGKTNALGQPLMYATLNATNTVNFLGATNARLWSLLSIGVYANGSNQDIIFPTNLPLLATNNMTLTNGQYILTLTNAHLLRLTFESNEFGLEPQWTIKP